MICCIIEMERNRIRRAIKALAPIARSGNLEAQQIIRPLVQEMQRWTE